MKHILLILISISLGYGQDFIQYPQPFKPTFKDTLKNLKVVVIMGYVEPELETIETRRTFKKEYIDAFALYGIKVNIIESCGIKCKYVESVCKDADIIIYNGHGGLNYDTIPVGFNFETNSYSGYFIHRDLSNIINPNALIIYIQACTGAGSSAADRYDIGFDEAKRRVYYNGSVYPKNSAYYAWNTSSRLSGFLFYFLNKKLNVNDIYNKFECNCYSKGKRIDTYKQYNINNKIIKLEKFDYGDVQKYGHAYYADPNYNISSIFKSKPVKYIK